MGARGVGKEKLGKEEEKLEARYVLDKLQMDAATSLPVASGTAAQSHRQRVDDNIMYRRLEPADQAHLRGLHDILFPIAYPDNFFSDAVSPQSSLRSFGAFNTDGHLVGFLVYRISPASSVDLEDKGVVYDPQGTHSIVYILTLGVAPKYQSHGIGSSLVALLLASHAVSQQTCKAIFLHVLASNARAVTFYRRRGFKQFRTLPDYYNINGKPAAAYSFVRYTNAGRPASAFDPLISLLSTPLEMLASATASAWHAVRAFIAHVT